MKTILNKATLPVALGISAISINSGAITQESRPDIILILADDMGYSDLGCYGSEIRTPNLDRLAEQGVRMTQFYNASRSCPTRASLLTGLYQHQAGVGDMVADLGYSSYQGYLNDDCVTLAQVLKQAGYKTYMSGKWHVGNREGVHPLDRGFDRFFGLVDGGGSYFRRIAYRPNSAVPLWMEDRKDYTPPDTGFYLTDAIAEHALTFIDEGSAKTGPFFLYLAFTAPHWPLHALPEDIDRYRERYKVGWDELRKERFARMQKLGVIETGARLSQRDKNSPEWNSLKPEEKSLWSLRMAVYAAMVDRMDQNIGRIINKLKTKGRLENTLIIFLSDNGGCHETTRSQAAFLKANDVTGSVNSFDAYEYPWANVSNTPFRMFKHWVHEGGISSPFIAWYPKEIKSAIVTGTPGHIIDIMPTLTDYAKARYPETYKDNIIPAMEGISLRPLLRGGQLKRSSPLFWEHEGNRAVRNGDWKLVSAYDYQAKKPFHWELYNIREDRSELNDLSEKNPEKKFELLELYCNWAEHVGVIPKEQIDRKRD